MQSHTWACFIHLASPCPLQPASARLIVRGNWTRVVLFCCILGCLLFLICIEFVYLYFSALFCLSVSVKWLAVKTTSEMTYTVSSGVLNSAPTNLGWLSVQAGLLLYWCRAYAAWQVVLRGRRKHLLRRRLHGDSLWCSFWFYCLHIFVGSSWHIYIED